MREHGPASSSGAGGVPIVAVCSSIPDGEAARLARTTVVQDAAPASGAALVGASAAGGGGITSSSSSSSSSSVVRRGTCLERSPRRRPVRASRLPEARLLRRTSSLRAWRPLQVRAGPVSQVAALACSCSLSARTRSFSRAVGSSARRHRQGPHLHHGCGRAAHHRRVAVAAGVHAAQQRMVSARRGRSKTHFDHGAGARAIRRSAGGRGRARFAAAADEGSDSGMSGRQAPQSSSCTRFPGGSSKEERQGGAARRSAQRAARWADRQRIPGRWRRGRDPERPPRGASWSEGRRTHPVVAACALERRGAGRTAAPHCGRRACTHARMHAHERTL